MEAYNIVIALSQMKMALCAFEENCRILYE